MTPLIVMSEVPARRRNVCIIQPVMKQYRLPFFQGLQHALARQGVSLTVVYGRPWAREALRGDNVRLTPPLGHEVPNLYLFNRLLLQPVWRPWWRADLVVVEQANKHALNFVLLALRTLGLKRLAYWGHGRDMQADPRSPGERFKRRLLTQADWWFAYNDQARDYVARQGYDPLRITSVQNAVDTRSMAEQLTSVTTQDKAAALAALRWPAQARIGVYCGSLYANKQVGLLIEQAQAIRAAVPDFHLLVIGGGPDEAALRARVADIPWIRLVGPRFGRDQAVLLSLAQLWLNPGLLGLGVLQAFCAGLPVITQDLAIQSPERAYLHHGINGLVTPEGGCAYADAVIELLRDPERLAGMRQGACESARQYSIETMVDRFTDGVLACLRRC